LVTSTLILMHFLSYIEEWAIAQISYSADLFSVILLSVENDGRTGSLVSKILERAGKEDHCVRAEASFLLNIAVTNLLTSSFSMDEWRSLKLVNEEVASSFFNLQF